MAGTIDDLEIKLRDGVRAGERVKMVLRTQDQVEGRWVGLRSDSVVLANNRAFALKDVAQLSVRRTTRLRWGLIEGVVMGSVGSVSVRKGDSSIGSADPKSSALFAIVGAGLGTVMGQFCKHWVKLYPPPLKVEPAPDQFWP